MYTLCVIDMQNQFGVHPFSHVANNCEREIRKAVQDGAGILLVEYWGCGATIHQLAKLTQEFPQANIQTITKHGDNGGKEISMAIWKHGMSSSHFKVVGVNTDCCVYQTCNGLMGHYPNAIIEVVADACDSTWSHKSGLVYLQELGCRIA